MSLQRLGVEALDLLLLHRPDYLFETHEVAEVFSNLEASGKVRFFGVSNFAPSQVDLLASAVGQPLMSNQVEINLHRIAALHDGTLDQCQSQHLLPQAWSWGNTFDDADKARIDAELTRQGEHYGASKANIALAWLLRHPASIAPIIGSTTPERIREAVTSLDIDYSREDWYRLLEARNGHEVP